MKKKSLEVHGWLSLLSICLSVSAQIWFQGWETKPHVTVHAEPEACLKFFLLLYLHLFPHPCVCMHARSSLSLSKDKQTNKQTTSLLYLGLVLATSECFIFPFFFFFSFFIYTFPLPGYHPATPFLPFILKIFPRFPTLNYCSFIHISIYRYHTV